MSSNATLENILIDSASYLDLEASTPTGDELSVRSNYADRAVREAASATRLKEFSKIYETSFSGPTISLPTNFREEEDVAYVLDTSGQWVEFPIIKSRDKYRHNISDQFGYISGNRAEGYTLVLNSMASYSTLSIPYQQYPTGLTTLTSMCELSDELYVTRKIEALVLESRSDDRFQIVDADANRRLANMSGRSNINPPGKGNRTRTNFRNPLS